MTLLLQCTSHPHLQGPNHTTNSQQAYAIRLAKERQLHQQRYIQQQQQQLAATNAPIPHGQAQSSQAQSQSSSQQVSVSPATPSSPLTPMSSQHQQQKHHLPQPGFSRNPGSSVTSQAVKQRQRQAQQRQYQQPARQHPNQPQHAQAQQQAKLLKGMGRGNMLIYQNDSVDPSHINGLSVASGSQPVEKGDQITQMMQGQTLYPGSGLDPSQPPKPPVSAHPSNNCQLQQKLHSGSTSSSLKQHKPLASSSDSNIQIPVSPGHSESLSASQPDSLKIDQQPGNSASQVSTSTSMSQGSMDSASVLAVAHTASSQWKSSEPPFGSPNPVIQVSSVEGTSIGNSAATESLTVNQGQDPRQSSANLPSHARNSGPQWQHHQPLLRLLTEPNTCVPERKRNSTEQSGVNVDGNVLAASNVNNSSVKLMNRVDDVVPTSLHFSDSSTLLNQNQNQNMFPNWGATQINNNNPSVSLVTLPSQPLPHQHGSMHGFKPFHVRTCKVAIISSREMVYRSSVHHHSQCGSNKYIHYGCHLTSYLTTSITNLTNNGST
ncbi:chromatin modification-related protein EAF1 B [Lathyrus oleraceus]|uniref:chromatin modification-related protein EAF1 B n=1 Tax=Pisum sativum TaxID=3888 RepID=UPI0021CF1BB4|nr:chromatin modification-related protein EAF1 B-like [Pisum sativum]